MLNLAQVLSTLASAQGVTLAEVTYRIPLNPSKRQDGSLSRHVVKLGVTTESLYNEDIPKLQEMLPTLDGIAATACAAILASRQESLQKGIGNNDAYTCKDVYTFVDGVQGVKVHKETGALYLNGLSLSREVLEAGVTLPAVNSKELTIAKRQIEKSLPSRHFRQFTLKNISEMAIYGETLKIEAEG